MGVGTCLPSGCKYCALYSVYWLLLKKKKTKNKRTGDASWDPRWGWSSTGSWAELGVDLGPWCLTPPTADLGPWKAPVDLNPFQKEQQEPEGLQLLWFPMDYCSFSSLVPKPTAQFCSSLPPSSVCPSVCPSRLCSAGRGGGCAGGPGSLVSRGNKKTL